jgi:hypothetical protein
MHHRHRLLQTPKARQTHHQRHTSEVTNTPRVRHAARPCPSPHWVVRAGSGIRAVKATSVSGPACKKKERATWTQHPQHKKTTQHNSDMPPTPPFHRKASHHSDMPHSSTLHPDTTTSPSQPHGGRKRIHIQLPDSESPRYTLVHQGPGNNPNTGPPLQPMHYGLRYGVNQSKPALLNGCHSPSALPCTTMPLGPAGSTGGEGNCRDNKFGSYVCPNHSPSRIDSILAPHGLACNTATTLTHQASARPSASSQGVAENGEECCHMCNIHLQQESKGAQI